MEQDETQDRNVDFTPRQTLAMPYIAANPSMTEAAKAAGISRVTLYRWMQDPSFRAELERIRRDAVDLAYAELRGLALKSVTAIAELLEDPDPRVRGMAARTALNSVAKAEEVYQLRNRFDILDRAISLLKNSI